MGAMELQIFVSLLVVLGAAFVALICDFLKGNNEKLREFNIELVTRQEERERSSVSLPQARLSGQALAGRSAWAANPAEAPSGATAPGQSFVSLLAEGIPANPRRRRAGRDAASSVAPQTASNVEPQAPVAAIVAMEDWAKRVVEQSVSGRNVQATPTPGQAEGGVAPDVPLAVLQDAQVSVSPDLPMAGTERLETIPVQADAQISAAEATPIDVTGGPGMEMPDEVEFPEQERVLPLAGLSGLENQLAPSNMPAAEPVLMDPGPMVMDTLAGSPGAGLSGLQRASQPYEELAPLEARIQSLPEPAKPVDAGRKLIVPEPRPAQPEFGAATSNETGAQLGQTEETLPLAGAAELPTGLSQPSKRVAAEAAAPVMSHANAEPRGIPSAIWTGTLGPVQLTGGQTVPVSTAAAGLAFEARALEPQAAAPELPDAAFSLESGAWPQPPDWTVEGDEPAAPVAAEPEPLSIIDAGEEEPMLEALLGEGPAGMEETAGPGPDEVVRVRVLDEGDLLQPCGLIDLSLEPVAPAAIPEYATLDAGLTRWVAGLEDGPEIGNLHGGVLLSVAGEAMPFAGLVAGQVDAVHTGVGSQAAVPEPALIIESGMVLPRVQCGEQVDQDFESIALSFTESPTEIGLEPEQPESLFPPAPPMDFEIEPVADAGNRFIVVDNEPEMNAKVVQMPLPVQAACEPPARVALRIPRGIHDRAVFEDLAAHDAMFDGVVFLVGVMGFEHLVADHGQPAVAQAIEEATSYFDGLLNTDGFGCWIEDSAFVMIIPAASAEETRLISTHTAEGLWDYQLRSLGSLPLIFHWGSAESCNEHLDAAVGRAREQMLESGRARKQVLTASGRFRRRVVNG